MIYLGGHLTPAIDKLTAEALQDGRESAVRSGMASIADREAEGRLNFYINFKRKTKLI